MIATLFLQVGSTLYAEEIDNNKTKTVEVKLIGVEGVLEKNIEARLPAFKPECSADKETIERYQRTLVKKHDKASRALGYYHSTVAISIKKLAGCWLLVMKVNPGPVVRVVKQDIKFFGEGRNEKAFTEIPFPYKLNDPLNHLKYTEYKSALEEVAQEKGYLAAKFKAKEILVDLKKNTAKIMLHFETGKRYRFGEVTVEQSVLEGKFLDRYILIKQKQYFSSIKIIEQQQLLQNSGYYTSVSIQPDYDHAKNGIIPVKIVLIANKRNHYRIALGYGTDTGFRSKASLDRRWTGSSGKKLNITLGLSQRINEISTKLLVPKENPEKNNLLYTANLKREINNDVRSESIRIGVASTSFTDGDWQRNISLTHLSDRTRVEGQSTNQSSLTLLGVQYAKVRAENRIFPQKGWRVRLAAEGAIDKVLSDATVLQLRAHGKYITPLGKGRLLLRTDLGATFGDSLDNLPKDLRFFAGGINSIRGYGYETLGELNEEGKIIGGKNLVEVSVEYEYPLVDKWSIAGFVDAGNAFDDINTNAFKVGVGLGVRWRSPIGPVRVDFGVPTGDLTDLNLHISIGPDL